MRQITCTLILLMTKLFIQAQVITVTATTLQKFNHSANISTIDAIANGAIEYPHYTVGNNVYVFDLNKRTMSMNGGAVHAISKINESENVLDCIVFDNGFDVLYVMGETSNNQTQFLSEWFKEDKIVGYFSMNSDFSYTVK